MKKMIIASSSTVYGSGYLEYLLPTLRFFFVNIKTILFIPYARPEGISYDTYTAIAKKTFLKIDIDVKGIHEFENPKEAIKGAKGIFTGGGNTFELLNELYRNDVLSVIKNVIEKGTPYLGTSAGSNICGVTMMNTNDMPIVYPPSFKTLACIPFNINAHYIDPIVGSSHMGETRETRIKEFHIYNDTTVLGLREGSWLEISDAKIVLRGKHTARLFKKNEKPIELESGNPIYLFQLK